MHFDYVVEARRFALRGPNNELNKYLAMIEDASSSPTPEVALAKLQAVRDLIANSSLPERDVLLAIVYNQMGFDLKRLGRYKESVDTYNLALRHVQSLGDEAFIRKGLGKVLYLAGNFQEAANNLLTSIVIFLRLGNTDEATTLLLHLGHSMADGDPENQRLSAANIRNYTKTLSGKGEVVGPDMVYEHGCIDIARREVRRHVPNANI